MSKKYVKVGAIKYDSIRSAWESSVRAALRRGIEPQSLECFRKRLQRGMKPSQAFYNPPKRITN